MRQSGVIAAAALYALDHNWDRLAEDHDNARHLSEGLANIKGLEIDVPRMETNLVFFEITKPGWTAAKLVEACKERGVGIGANTGHAHPRRHPSRRQPRRHRHRAQGDQRRAGGLKRAHERASRSSASRSLRREDRRFLTGRGRYADNTAPADALAVLFVRSPHAHARLTGIDKTAALASPGVAAIYTADDLLADKVGHLPAISEIKDAAGNRHREPPHLPMPAGKVRHVGDIVAMIVAEHARPGARRGGGCSRSTTRRCRPSSRWRRRWRPARRWSMTTCRAT